MATRTDNQGRVKRAEASIAPFPLDVLALSRERPDLTPEQLAAIASGAIGSGPTDNAIYCHHCTTLLGFVRRPDSPTLPNQVGSGKHIRLLPIYAERPGPIPYYVPGTMPTRADSRRHVQPEFQADPFMATLLRTNREDARETHVPHSYIIVKCHECAAENEVTRPESC